MLTAQACGLVLRETDEWQEGLQYISVIRTCMYPHRLYFNYIFYRFEIEKNKGGHGWQSHINNGGLIDIRTYYTKELLLPREYARFVITIIILNVTLIFEH